MKKLMTVIAAVAMSFGLFADATPFSISFESAESAKGVDAANLKFTPGTGWTWAGDALDMVAYDGDEYAGYGAEGSATARRNGKFDGDDANLNYLKLETGSAELARAMGAENIFVDQLVKFTGFEEPQTELANGTKIAVWMSGIEGDNTVEPVVEGETNLYVTCAKVANDGSVEQIALKINGDFETEKWYRLTIKSIGDIFGGSQEVTARAGFIVYIDGVQVGSSDPAATDLIATKSYMTTDAAGYMAAGQLFPAIDATDTIFTTVAYKGIGSIDDVILDDKGPAFCQTVPVTIAPVTGALIDKVLDKNGKEVTAKDGKYELAPGAFQIVWKNDTGYITFSKTIDHNTGDTQPIDDSAALAKDIKELVALVDGEIECASLAEALAIVEENDAGEVEIVKDCEYEIADVGLYSFNEGAFITIDGTAWEVDAAEGVVTNTFGTVPGKQITVTNGKLALAGMILAGDDTAVASITADEVELVGDLDVGMLGDQGEFGAALTIAEEGVLTVGEFKITLHSAGAVYYADEGALITAGDIVSAETGKVVDYNEGVYSLVDEAADVVEIVGTGAKYKSLDAAIDEAQDGDELKLLADIEVADWVVVAKAVTIDFGTFKLTPADGFERDALLCVNHGGDVTLNGTTGGIDSENKMCAIKFTSTKDDKIVIAEASEENKAKLKIVGGVYAGYNYGISGNGNLYYQDGTELPSSGADYAAAYWTRGNCELVVNGGTIQATADDGVAIYQPQDCVTTINNGTITGKAFGIYAKSGSVAVTGGDISSTATAFVDPTVNNNGANGSGVAMVVETGSEQGAYANHLTFSVTGGKFTSVGPAVVNFVRTGAQPIAAGISGGLFTAQPDAALLTASTTEGYKAAWVEDETVTGYWKPGLEAITYNITYTVVDEDGDAVAETDYSLDATAFPETYTVEDAITFDSSKVTIVNTEKYEAVKSIAPASIVKGTTGEQPVTITLTKKAAVEPIVPGEEKELQADNLEDAIKEAQNYPLQLPTGAADEKYYKKTAIKGTDGKFYAVVDVDETQVTPESVKVDETAGVTVSTESFVATVKDAIPGLFYGFVTTGSLGGETAPAYTDVTSSFKQAEKDVPLTLTAPKAGAAPAAFFKISVRASAPKAN